MQKTFNGKIVSLKMQNTAIVEVVRKSPHQIYKKLLKRSKRFKADTAGLSLNLGDNVKIVEVKPMSKDKKFKVLEVLK